MRRHVYSRFRRLGFLLSELALIAALTGATPGASANAVQVENAKPGTTEWRITNHGYASGVIEGYASLTSVNVGGQINLYVNTAEPTYTIDLFRMGYYGGTGGRRVTPTISRTGVAQPKPSPDPATGMIECHWVDPYVLIIPGDWVSGIYLAKLTAGATGKQQYIVFAVRDDSRPSDFLFQQSVTTYQAYNVWGGMSLYGTIANRGDTDHKADKVSFNRPYYGEESDGALNFFWWEFGMIQWLESRGYDLTYATSVDVDRDASLLLSHRAFLVAGHDEYWTWKMRDNVEHARDQGVHLRFFAGNTAYWQVRLEPSPATGEASRTLVGYKEHWANDPITPGYLKTNVFRDASVNRPEDPMLGGRFVTQGRPACLLVEDAQNWVFANTGLHNGDCVRNSDGTTFLGYEVDSIGPLSPANTRRLAHSPTNASATDYSDMTFYRATSGATVVSTGSIGWSQSIPSITQLTANLLDCVLSDTCYDWTPQRPPPPPGFRAADIGDTGRQGFVAGAEPGRISINGAGHGLPTSTSDGLFYVYQSLPVDGQIVVQLTSLRLFWDNRAGVMIRESLAPDAKYVAIAARPTGSIGAVKEGAEFLVRDQAATRPRIAGSRDFGMPNWMKLTRSGDRAEAFVSPDGTNWSSLGSASVPMSAPAMIGVFVVSSQPGVWATANFENLAVTGATLATSSSGPPGPATLAPMASLTSALTSTDEQVLSANEQVLSALGRSLDALRIQSGIPGMAAALVDEHGVLWQGAFGYQDIRTSTPARTDTPFELAGLARVVAATMTLECVDEGKITLDQPVGGSSLRQILSHTSGTPGNLTFAYDPARAEALEDIIRTCRATTLRRAVRDELERLGMMDSVPGRDATSPLLAAVERATGSVAERYRSVLARLATPYTVDTANRATPSRYSSTAFTADSGLVSTVLDFAKFDLALKRGVLLRRDTLAAAWTNPVNTDGQALPHGLGWFVQTYNGEPVVWQFGADTDGASALAITLPRRMLTLVLVANSDGLAKPVTISAGDVTVSPFARAFLSLVAR